MATPAGKVPTGVRLPVDLGTSRSSGSSAALDRLEPQLAAGRRHRQRAALRHRPRPRRRRRTRPAGASAKRPGAIRRSLSAPAPRAAARGARGAARRGKACGSFVILQDELEAAAAQRAQHEAVVGEIARACGAGSRRRRRRRSRSRRRAGPRARRRSRRGWRARRSGDSQARSSPSRSVSGTGRGPPATTRRLRVVDEPGHAHRLLPRRRRGGAAPRGGR